MVKEIPFFFPNKNGNRLYGILYEGAKGLSNTNTANNTVIIYSRPIFGEFHTGHRVMANFARVVANKGYHFLRYDYYGDGDSEGSFEDSSISSRILDISSAINFVMERISPSRIFLMGVRFGASLSLLASDKFENIDGIIAWAPICNLNKYIYSILRINLTNQMALHKKDIKTRKELILEIERGNNINIEGYQLSNLLWTECCEADILKNWNVRNKQSLIVQISENDKIENEYKGCFDFTRNSNINFKQIVDRKFWIRQKIVYSKYEELFKTTIDWVRDI